jgi:sugar/nucleoside kinase (ribokinase family)
MTSPSGPDTLRIVVIGDLMVDIVAGLSGPVAHGSDTRAEISTARGGSGANVAAWLGMQGVDTTYVGCVGEDALGRAALEELAAGGVTVRAAVSSVLSTGMCIVLVEPGGERSMLPHAGANQALRPDDLPLDVFLAGTHVHLSGYTLLHEGSREAGLSVLSAARDASLTVSVDPSSSALLATTGVEDFLRWTSGVDLILANAEEATLLAGVPGVHEAAQRLAASYDEVVVKLGSSGALWHSGFISASAPAEGGIDVVDTTGAGDAFAAGFLVSWLLHPEPETALAAGNRLAAQVLTRFGARP